MASPFKASDPPSAIGREKKLISNVRRWKWRWRISSATRLSAPIGAAKRWPEIAKLNNIRDPNTLKVGQVLKLPPS